MSSAIDQDLKLALDAADVADRITVERFGAQDLRVSTKPDRTYVTDADQAAEDAIRQLILHARPGDSLLGEERGTEGESRRRWIIDPIDGTHNFLRGVPLWATLIALVEDDQVVLGVVSAPALNRRWWARLGQGAYCQWMDREPRQIQVSEIAALEDASLSYASLGGWAQFGREAEFAELMGQMWRTRAYGDFYSYMLVAEGVVDVAAEPELALYDMAALVPIVTEAGGRFTSLGGEDGPWGGNAVATNGHLHSLVLDCLGTRAGREK
ncbi:MAG: histidinol-phosphatase [Actinomycetaceae bacterium]|nr:histidinol-phosphatase [Actinomycetaceae bacterium]